ncbi:OsmC family protein [Algoriphagus sediminis]|uniref:OsmC family protein n=1 Tax=Algoriphagus sediminis TaxID=3057113 RepID=A0ABT7YF01_9BACT|nr:OsmC family protein [Algoriphagus sediminis]MDN3205103.1 OsmC family protein [Algoriphagus sediminis]
MSTIKSSYLGELRTKSVHIASQDTIISDAPLDNNGRGEAFSPTDTVAGALGSCMVTIMGIIARREGQDMEGLSWEVTKAMQSNPRKIAEIIIEFNWDQPFEDEKLIKKMKNGAKTCPVALSLHPDIKQTVIFNF